MRAAFGALLALSLSFTSANAAELLDQDFRRLAGDEVVNLGSAYSGKVVLVVNTASKCGNTPQYEGLESLYEEYEEAGLVVLGFPSNDFMGQEPGTEAEIQEFCRLTYSVKFPMFEKVHVKGNDTTPFYRDLKARTGDVPAWNFHKFLIDRNGKVIGSFPSKVKPDDAQIVSKIEAALKAN